MLPRLFGWASAKHSADHMAESLHDARKPGMRIPGWRPDSIMRRSGERPDWVVRKFAEAMTGGPDKGLRNAQHPAQRGDGEAVVTQRSFERHRQLRSKQQEGRRLVVEIAPDARQIMDRLDAQRTDFTRRTDARMQQDCR